MMQAANLTIEGMHCNACVQRVTKALGNLPGMMVNQVQLGSASISYDPAQTNPAAISEAVNDIGFEVVNQEAC